MRHTRRKGLAVLMATGGALALAAGAAHADSHADGGAADSPGAASGNVAQLPFDSPVNVCGNTVNAAGALNPAASNTCENEDEGTHEDGYGDEYGYGDEEGDAGEREAGGSGAYAVAGAKGSPGALAGNGVQLPFDLPVNVSGNAVSVVGLLNPATGNTSENEGGEKPVTPPETPECETPTTPPEPAKPEPPVAPKPETPAPLPAPEPQTGTPELAQTGADGLVGTGLSAAAGLVLGGGLLYRRFRPTRTDA